MSLSDADVAALVAAWRARARTYRTYALESYSAGDIQFLAILGLSLELAARELCDTSGIHPNDGLPVANAEAERAPLETDIQPACDAKGSEP